MLELTLIPNFKNAFHALMVVLHARPVMIVLNADQTTLWMLNQDFVLKFVVMEKDTLLNVMMVTTLMEMDVQKIVTLKLDSHVMVDHQALKTAVQPFFQLPSQLKTEVNQDFMEKSFLMLDLTTCQRPFFNQLMIVEITATLC